MHSTCRRQDPLTLGTPGVIGVAPWVLPAHSSSTQGYARVRRTEHWGQRRAGVRHVLRLAPGTARGARRPDHRLLHREVRREAPHDRADAGRARPKPPLREDRGVGLEGRRQPVSADRPDRVLGPLPRLRLDRRVGARDRSRLGVRRRRMGLHPERDRCARDLPRRRRDLGRCRDARDTTHGRHAHGQGRRHGRSDPRRDDRDVHDPRAAEDRTTSS